jgi:cohesin loading factor subunit SCC2
MRFRRIKYPSTESPPSSEQEAVRIERLSEEVGSVQSLKGLFLPILNVVLVALDAPPVFMRTKALRALGQIVTSDPSILSMVRQSHPFASHPNLVAPEQRPECHRNSFT